MVTSETTGEILKAISQVQWKLTALPKIKQAARGKYVPLELIIEAIREPFHEAGLCYTQSPQWSDGQWVLRTRIFHSSGEWIGGDLPLMAEKNTHQGVGSAITYMRRYALGTILGIASESDDDGEKARFGQVVQQLRSRREDAPKAERLCDTIIKNVEAETNPGRMGHFTDRINLRKDQDRLTDAEAQECLAAVAKRTIELATKEPALKLPGKSENEVVGV